MSNKDAGGAGKNYFLSVLPRPALHFLQGFCLFLIVILIFSSWIWPNILLFFDLSLNELSLVDGGFTVNFFALQWAYQVYWIALSIMVGTFYSRRTSYSIGSLYGFYKTLLERRFLFYGILCFVIFAVPVLLSITAAFIWNGGSSIPASIYPFYLGKEIGSLTHFFTRPLLIPVIVFFAIICYVVAAGSASGKNDYSDLRQIAVLIRYHLWRIPLEDQIIDDDC